MFGLVLYVCLLIIKCVCRVGCGLLMVCYLYIQDGFAQNVFIASLLFLLCYHDQFVLSSTDVAASQPQTQILFVLSCGYEERVACLREL